MPAPARIVVVGAALAGLRAVEELRRAGHDGEIVVVGAESHLPYDRPPLSKALLAGTVEPEVLALARGGVEHLDARWRLGARATGLDAGARRLDLDDGSSVAFDGCVLAVGATPRTLPSDGLDGVFTLRTVDDALALRAALEAGPRVVVVGAGFIGAEVAATCRGRGLRVTVLEALAAPMVRGLGPELGGVLAALHREHGVDLRTGVGVAGFEAGGGADGRGVRAVVLDDGERVPADVVVVGIGVRPDTDWLEGSGLELADGVVCDETLLAAPGIVAAGDVCRWRDVRTGELVRLEHWTNAAEQGAAAARRLLAGDEGEPFTPVPYVWSDQYDVKIQVLGRVRGDDVLVVVDGTLAGRRFAALVGRGARGRERVVGAVGFGRPRALMQCRPFVERAAPLSEAVRELGS